MNKKIVLLIYINITQTFVNMYYLYPTLCIILMYNMIQAENILHFIFVIVLHKHCRTSLGSWIFYPHLLIPKSWYQTFIKPNENLNPRTTMTKYYLIRWWIFSTSQLHKGSTSMFCCCDVVVKGHLFKLYHLQHKSVGQVQKVNYWRALEKWLIIQTYVECNTVCCWTIYM